MENKIEPIVNQKFNALLPILDEKSRRLWAAAEAKFLGHGSISTVSKATGLSRTIHQGLKELERSSSLEPATKRIRAKGGGRKPIIKDNPTILNDIELFYETGRNYI